MKSQALKTAWILFRKYQITFSQALVEGWKKAKREFLRIEFTKTSNDEISYRNRLVRSFNELKEIHYLQRFVQTEINIEGAKHDYGVGIYNGD